MAVFSLQLDLTIEVNHHFLKNMYGHLSVASNLVINLSTVPLETMGPFARGKTSSLPNVIAANSPRWDENRNRGKDESNRKPR